MRAVCAWQKARGKMGSGGEVRGEGGGGIGVPAWRYSCDGE